MKQTTLEFNSQRAPGSVVVRKNGESVAMIVKCTSGTSTKIKFGDWFVVAITLTEPLREQLTSVPFGPYDDVKEHVVKIFADEAAS